MDISAVMYLHHQANSRSWLNSQAEDQRAAMSHDLKFSLWNILSSLHLESHIFRLSPVCVFPAWCFYFGSASVKIGLEISGEQTIFGLHSPFWHLLDLEQETRIVSLLGAWCFCWLWSCLTQWNAKQWWVKSHTVGSYPVNSMQTEANDKYRVEWEERRKTKELIKHMSAWWNERTILNMVFYEECKFKLLCIL